MKPVGRKSIRLKGYDYSEPGGYFVTICTKGRKCTLGEIVDGEMHLSGIGKIVESCWNEIPAHFGNTRVNVFQMMPNHVHGIVEIKTNIKTVGVEYIQPLPKHKQHRYQHVIPKSLGSIIRSFKAAVTREVRRNTNQRDVKIWQRDFYDHIIRSDIDYYFVERYITLNPVLWHLDSDNPDVRSMPIDELKRILKERHGLDEHAITYLVDCEMNYRDWQETADESVGV